MTHKLDDNWQRIFFNHATGILLCLILLCLALSLSACNPATALSTHTLAATSTTVSTRSPTQLPSATFVPTISPPLSPSKTTIEPTWTPRPTSTPLAPTPDARQSYRLTTWTAEKAGQVIEYLQNYPEVIAQEYSSAGLYGAAFAYEGLAEMESAYRFPNAGQAKTWRQDGAFRQNQSINWDINSLYTSLITAALNRRETSLNNVSAWFAKVEPRLNLEVIPVRPPVGYQNSAILHVQTNDQSGFTGAFAFWLLQKGGVFSGYPLSNMDNASYHEIDSKVGIQDITGDGFSEAIIQNTEWQSFGLHFGTLTIYRLDQVPPREVAFDAPPPDASIAEWSVDKSQSIPTITFRIPVNTTSDMPCNDFKVDWQYQWQGDTLTFVRVVLPPVEAMAQDPMCTRILVSILGSTKYLDNMTALETYQQLLDLPFIAKVRIERGDTLFIDKDRFSLALYLMDHGDKTGANEQIEQIRTGSDPDLIEWRKDVLAYFANRRNPQALLQFCLTIKKCDDFLDQTEMIALVPPSRFSEIDTLLPQMGIGFSASGNYDFDQDGQAEKWLFFRTTTGCGNTFWILAKTEDRIKSRRAADLCLPYEIQSGEKVNITPIAPSGGLPAYQISITGQEQDAEKFLYWPLDQEDPTIDIVQAEQMIDTLENKLLLRQISSAEAQEQILRIQNLPLEPNHWLPQVQAHLLYLLGLTQELNGVRSQAAQTYLELWQTYPDSPYALMAYAKLERAP